MARPHVIVLGNEKGGTGKSTICMHIAMHFLADGRKVGTVDVDARQGTLTRYINNRLKYQQTKQISIATPQHFSVHKSNLNEPESAKQEEQDSFDLAMQKLSDHDFILIDTPGNDTFLSRLAHSHADTIITPLNDSFVDLDMLVRVDEDNLSPSLYSEMVWEQRKSRMMRDKRSIDWIVMRNRLTNLYSHNRGKVEDVLISLAKRIGFRLATGFNERVIFRELFVSGLTLLDFELIDRSLTISHVTAKQELRDLVGMIKVN
ncbi:MAG: division plane positioning ATPase MipZ [Holosporales bacterium]|nr:division plane positioning ATPase MipZ [Holosporales bacterium]